MIDVCLVAMPYAAVEHPSLALGILKTSLIKQDISSQVCYANIAFAEYIGLPNYFFLSNNLPKLLMGEWTFAGAAFPDFQPDHARYLQECQQWQVGEKFLWNIRNQASAFIERIAHKILATQPQIIGCSSMFQQHCASLAVLKRIKTLRPDVVTLLGGANCEGSMGYVTHQCFEWIDYVVSGEAELFLPSLCRNILQRGQDISQAELPEGVYGPALRKNGIFKPSVARAMVHDLDASPTPVYDEYFETLNASPLANNIKPGLVFETSRGCWWGQKKQCAFCGLSERARIFRVKSPQHILDELDVLRQTYGIKKFMATDTILDMKHFDTILPELANAQDKYIFFFDVSANLTKSQVKQMSEAGIRWIQPGIESLHDNILTLLNKGTRTLKNIQLLKWCMQYGIFASWNFLANAPGDAVEWYREMLTWLPLISHLQPPMSLWLIRYDRFSQFHQQPERYNLKLEPFRAYANIYPISPEQLREFAYFFEDVSSQPDEILQEKMSVFNDLTQFIGEWQELFYAHREDIIKKEVSDTRPMLDMREIDGQLFLKDTRPCAVQSDIVLDGLAREIYQTCDAALTAEQLIKSLQSDHIRNVSWDDIEPIVDQLLAQKILLQLRDRFISLAISKPYSQMLTFDDDPAGLVMLPRTPKQRKGDL